MVRSADLREGAALEALAELCELYWSPLYAFARRGGLDPEDAADRVQGFFAHLLESGRSGGATLDSANPERGRFRTYLLGAFRNYLAGQRRRGAALKRGAGAPLLSLDTAPEESRPLDPSSDETPEDLFQRRWALALLELALGRLEREYDAAGKGELFEALEPLITGDAGRGGSKEIAERLGSSPGAVRVAAHRLRKRFGELLRHEVAQTVASSDQVEPELRHLITLFERTPG